MKLDLKKNNNFSRTLSVTMKWEEIKDDYYVEFHKIKSQYQLPGFRKGKVPDNILRKNLGPSIDSQFIDYAINIYYKKALNELKITPINQGKITDLDFKELSDLNFKISFEVKSEFKLPNYQKKVKIDTQKFIVNKNDLNNSIENLRAQFAKTKTIDGKLESGHYIYADFYKLDNNKEIIKDSVMKNHYIKIGEGLFVNKLADQFIGKQTGDMVDATIKQNSGMIEYKVQINKIEEQILPKVDDDFAKLVDSKNKSLNELNKNLSDGIQEKFNNDNAKDFRSKIIEFFINKTKLEVPDSLIENYKSHLLNQYKKQFTANNQKFDEDKHAEEITQTASKTVKWHLVREKLIEAESVKVSSKEVEDYIETMIKANPGNKVEIKKYYNEENNKYNLHEEIVNNKLFVALENFFINKIKESSTDKLKSK